MYSTPVADMRFAGRPSLDALRRLQELEGVDPNTVPYSDEERAMARGQRAQELNARQKTWEEQRRMFPFGPPSQSPVDESKLAERLSPSWSRFMDHYADVPYLAAGRGLKGRVDLVGQGPGTGTGIGRWMGQVGRAGSSGSFEPTQSATDLETLVGDARNTNLSQYDRTAALKALRMFGGR